MSKTEEHETLLGDCETVWELYVVGYDEDGNQCRYGENVREVDYNPKWTCPCCREICSCNSCPCYYAVYNSRRKHYLLLNVLSAAVDFPTCDFIRMSLSVGKTGLRTLAVVTKADKSSEGLLEKILPDDVNIETFLHIELLLSFSMKNELDCYILFIKGLSC
ncbi:unnamed protein product [Trifolium pratense]|uniref:Uncharacterized protein n=1 Tax=Trifolium pratense TaxID=57577 RepID=A0ACB0KDE5_TRIPR|nr:unnamed protein product [Trifolium pratense]